MDQDTGKKIQKVGCAMTASGCLILLFLPLIAALIVWIYSWFVD